MKRRPRVAPLLALLMLAAIVTGTLLWRERRDRWQPLPGGGEVRLLAVTHGTQHSVELGGPSWSERARSAWRTRSVAPLAERTGWQTTMPTNSPSTVLWLEARNLPASGFRAGSAELVLPDGQTFRAGNSSGGSHGNAAWPRWHHVVTFPLVAARVKTLRFIVRIDGRPSQFDVPNPAYRTDLPVWSGEPLPQTREYEDVSLTLKSLTIEPDSMPSAAANWKAMPAWSITRAGKPADAAFTIDARFADPSGNASEGVGLFSEPVWKVIAIVSSKASFSENPAGWFSSFKLEFVIDAPVPPGTTQHSR